MALRDPLNRQQERALVFGIGGALLLLGSLGAVGAVGAIVQLEQPRGIPWDVEDQSWQHARVALPASRGDVVVLRRAADPDGGRWERRLRLMLRDVPGLELPVHDGKPGIGLKVDWWPAPDGDHLVVSDGDGIVAAHLDKGLSRRVHVVDGAAWLVDVQGPGVDGGGEVLRSPRGVAFVPNGPAKVRGLSEWPPASLQSLGVVHVVPGGLSWDPVD